MVFDNKRNNNFKKQIVDKMVLILNNKSSFPRLVFFSTLIIVLSVLIVKFVEKTNIKRSEIYLGETVTYECDPPISPYKDCYSSEFRCKQTTCDGGQCGHGNDPRNNQGWKCYQNIRAGCSGDWSWGYCLAIVTTPIPTSTPISTSTPKPTLTPTIKPISTPTPTPIPTTVPILIPKITCSDFTVSATTITSGGQITLNATAGAVGTSRSFYLTGIKQDGSLDFTKHYFLGISSLASGSVTYTIPSGITSGNYKIYSNVNTSDCAYACSWQSRVWSMNACPSISNQNPYLSNIGDCVSSCSSNIVVIPSLSCSMTTLRDTETISVGQTITSSFNVGAYGRIYRSKVSNVGDRLVSGTDISLVSQGTGIISTNFTPTEAGIYVFETNAYDATSCNYFCSAGSQVYRNSSPGNCDSESWTNLGSNTCASNCSKYVVVNSSSIPTPVNVPPMCPIYKANIGTEKTVEYIIPVKKYINSIPYNHHDHNANQLGYIALQYQANGTWDSSINTIQGFDVNSGANTDYTCRDENDGMYPGTHNESDQPCYVSKSLSLPTCKYVENIKLVLTNGQITDSHSHFCFEFEPCVPSTPVITPTPSPKTFTIGGKVYCQDTGSTTSYPMAGVTVNLYNDQTKETVDLITSSDGRFSHTLTDYNFNIAVRMWSGLNASLTLSNGQPYSLLNWPPQAVNCSNTDISNCNLRSELCGTSNSSYENCGSIENVNSYTNFDFRLENCFSCRNITLPDKVTAGNNLQISCDTYVNNASHINFTILNNSGIQIAGYTKDLGTNTSAIWIYPVPLNLTAGTYYAECEVCDSSNNCKIGKAL